LNKIEKICYDIWAKNVIVHDSHIKEHEIYNEYSFKTLIENDDYKVEEFSNPKKFQEVLDSYPNLGFNFDFAHALTIWNDIVKKFIDNFKDRIFQVHMSNLTRDIKDHNFLYRDWTPETLELLEYFAEKINAPLVLECVASKEEEIDLIQKEIDFLRNFYD
jgi:sugar phosphate isomerase/epimerase